MAFLIDLEKSPGIPNKTKLQSPEGDFGRLFTGIGAMIPSQDLYNGLRWSLASHPMNVG